jgi:hypothetical protein
MREANGNGASCCYAGSSPVGPACLCRSCRNATNHKHRDTAVPAGYRQQEQAEQDQCLD